MTRLPGKKFFPLLRGVFNDMAVFTRLTMEGVIAFETSFRLRCEILKQIPLEHAGALVSSIPSRLRWCGLSPNTPRTRLSSRQPGRLGLRTGSGSWLSRFLLRGNHPGGALRNGRRIVDKARQRARWGTQGYDRVVCARDGTNEMPMLRPPM
jgi:hypothetical protein